MQFSGIPHNPKPPTKRVALEGMSWQASVALPTTLWIGMCYEFINRLKVANEDANIVQAGLRTKRIFQFF
jgi:hypothetical protein